MPRTLAENATYIAETIKPAIKQAIENKGVTVPSTDSFLDYADRIGEISGGGSGYQLKDLPTGSISTVSDAEPLPLNALKVSVEAWQDLHGYDHPWVGGAGKNKLPLILADIKAANTNGTWSGDTYTVNGVSFEVQTDDDGNITSIKVNGATTTTNARLKLSQVENMSGNILNGCPQGGSSSGYKLRLANSNDTPVGEDMGSGYTLTTNSIYRISINIGENTSASNLMFYPMIRLSSADPTFEPYSNICSFSGWSTATITDKDDLQNPTQTETWTHQFTDSQGDPLTCYGGEWNVVDGELKVTDGYIASYNGETLPDTWISDRDVYASGTTPTTGAEVVYKLATPQTIPQQAESIRMLEGTNNLYADCGEVIEGEYFSGDNQLYANGIIFAGEGDGGIGSYRKIDTLPTDLLNATAMTCEVCARFDSFVNLSSGPYARIITFGDDNQTGRFGVVGVAYDGSSSYDLCVWDDTIDLSSGLCEWTPTDTHTVAVVKTTAGTIKIYVDGVLKYTGSSALTITNTLIDYICQRSRYGASSDTQRQINGEIYAWRIYGKELSASQINANFLVDKINYID